MGSTSHTNLLYRFSLIKEQSLHAPMTSQVAHTCVRPPFRHSSFMSIRKHRRAKITRLMRTPSPSKITLTVSLTHLFFRSVWCYVLRLPYKCLTLPRPRCAQHEEEAQSWKPRPETRSAKRSYDSRILDGPCTIQRGSNPPDRHHIGRKLYGTVRSDD